MTTTPINNNSSLITYLHNKRNYSLLTSQNSDQIGGRTRRVKSKTKSKSKIKTKKSTPIDIGDEIVKLIETGSRKEITTNFDSIMTNKYACDKILGEGFAGKVSISTIGSIYMYRPNGEDDDAFVLVPTAIKDTKIDKITKLWSNKNMLYVYSDGGVVIETVILYYIRKLIRNKLSPHLPLILEHSVCNPNTTQSVDKIIVERHGLDKELEINIRGFYEGPLWRNVGDFDPKKPFYHTRLSTFDDLMIYINLSKESNSDIVELPNNNSCNIIKLIDYLTISYIITVDLLVKHNIYLLDMHPQNIFIHWLGDNSYMHDKFIGDTKYIFYKRGNRYFKIETFGLLLKIGDVGASIIKPQKNVIFSGQAYNIENTHHIIDYIINHPKYFDFPLTYNNTMSIDTLRKTCSHKILTTHPYDKIFWMSQDKSVLDDMPDPDKLLRNFDKYSVSKIDETEHYLVF